SACARIFSATGFQIPAAAGLYFPPAVPVFHRRVFVPAAVLPVLSLTGVAGFAVAAPIPPVVGRHRDAPAPAIAAVANCAAAGWRSEERRVGRGCSSRRAAAGC